VYTFNTFKSEATLVCTIPFTLNGSEIYRCTATGDWIGNGKCGRKTYNSVILLLMMEKFR